MDSKTSTEVKAIQRQDHATFLFFALRHYIYIKRPIEPLIRLLQHTLTSRLFLVFGRSSFFKIFLFSLCKDEITDSPAAAMLNQLSLSPTIRCVIQKFKFCG